MGVEDESNRYGARRAAKTIRRQVDGRALMWMGIDNGSPALCSTGIKDGSMGHQVDGH